MMKILQRIFIIVPFLFLITIGSIIGVVYFNLHSLEKQTHNYLIHHNGYTSSEIHSIKAKLAKLPLYQAVVIFKDEPENTYIYRKLTGQIIQIHPPKADASPEQFKHLE